MIAPLRFQSSHIPATLSAQEAASAHWDAVIIGAGPAGAAVALRLARRGLRVILVDAAPMPRPKVCGCCLSTTALAELRDLGVVDPGGLIAPRPLHSVTLAARGSAATIEMPAGGVMSRDALDAGLVTEAIAAGAAWLPETRVVSIDDACDSVVVECNAPKQGQTMLRAELAVIAGGLAPSIHIPATDRRHVGPDSRVGIGTVLPATAPGPEEGRLVMAVSRHGYCGMVRLEDGRIDVAAAVDATAVGGAGGPAALISRILTDALGCDEADRWAGDLARASFRGTPRLTHASPPVATPSGRVMRIGDAAAYVEPFTGEGMGWALATARLLDEALGWAALTPRIDATSAAARYAAAHARHLARHHSRCHRISCVVRRPLFVACAAGLARYAPAVAARVVPFVVGARHTLKESS
ncbi:MAG: FAD-dependent oxidoreductase [Pirellulales bacterium]